MQGEKTGWVLNGTALLLIAAIGGLAPVPGCVDQDSLFGQVSLLGMNRSLSPEGRGRFARRIELSSFQKGNTHTHTLRSDGDSSPEKVIEWYRSRGYQFLVLTDHDRASEEAEFREYDIPGRFIVVPGEEVSSSADSKDPRFWGKVAAVHANSLCSRRTVRGKHFALTPHALQDAIDRINEQAGAVAQINHPNFHWALTFDDLMTARGAPLLEIANQHVHVANEGDASHPPVEEIWDQLLTAGKLYYGVASDDIHDLHRSREDLGYPPRRGGLGWVQVALPDAGLTPSAICAAMARGDFYSSTGVELESIQVTERKYSLKIRVKSGESPTGYLTTFIGQGGLVLSTVEGLVSSYEIQGGEGYVRARVDGPGGKRAWLQPVMIQSGS